ncbi:MAG: carboxypeptidase regulatory-like domain-containing protein [Planctomycetes bacterium]|nr:carboxypeptidase regulatory-like domain-containing protein [Planctomycetota bacterium]
MTSFALICSLFCSLLFSNPSTIPVAASTNVAEGESVLAAVRGRLVEAHGAPIAGVTMTLLEFRGALTATFGEDPFDDVPADAMELVRDETHTDAEGRFALAGADVHRLHVLGIDLGRERATLRLIDAALERGASTDLGDVALAAGVTIHGRIVDAEGAPIAGARVRVLPPLALPLPPPLLELLLREQAPGRVMMAGRPGEVFIDLPEWARNVEQRLPLPTTTSAADGRFTLPSIPYGIVALAADHAEFVTVVKDRLPTGRDPTLDVGALTLARGRTVRGRLLADGQPLAGASVHAGPVTQLGSAGPTTWARDLGVVAADGSFTLHAVPEGAATLVGVRHRSGGPIQVLGPFVGDEFDVPVPAGATLTLHVTDAISQPRPDATLRFLVLGEAAASMRGFGLPHDFTALLGRGEPGTFTLRDMPQGVVLALARTSDSGWQSEQVSVSPAGGEVTLRLPVAAPRRVRVVAAKGGAPIAGAEVIAMAKTHDGLGDPLGYTRSDAAGRAKIVTLRHDNALALRVSHPGWCAAVHDDPLLIGGEDLLIELTRGGAVTGKLAIDADADRGGATLLLRFTGAAGALDDALPRFALPAADGTFRICDLRPGPWQIEVHPRLGRLAPTELIAWWLGRASPRATTTALVTDEATTPVEFPAPR